MVRIEVHGKPEDAAEMRAELKKGKYKLDELMSVPRGDNHPASKEPYFEERWQGPNGQTARLFPHSIYASGPQRNEPCAIVIEYKPQEA